MSGFSGIFLGHRMKLYVYRFTLATPISPTTSICHSIPNIRKKRTHTIKNMTREVECEMYDWIYIKIFPFAHDFCAFHWLRLPVLASAGARFFAWINGGEVLRPPAKDARHRGWSGIPMPTQKWCKCHKGMLKYKPHFELDSQGQGG